MSRRPHSQSGFVLVLTLWILVIITIAASYFSERVARSVELAQQSRQNTQAMIDMADTRAEILYRLGTTSLTVYGLGQGSQAIMLDNRVYRGLGQSLVRLQDDRGLLNINYAEDGRIVQLLGGLGIPADQTGRMIDTLRDYIDADDLPRLNGAEAPQYAELGLPPPRNSRLLTPWETQNIIGWRDQPQLWSQRQLADLITTSNAVSLNLNTAPWQVLATLPGVTPQLAQLIVARRQQKPFFSEADLATQTGLMLEATMPPQTSELPADSIRVTHSAPGLPWAWQYNVSLTPRGDDAPWRIDYSTKTGLTRADDNSDQAAELPARSNALPTAIPPFLSGL